MTVIALQAILESVASCYLDVLPQDRDTGITVSFVNTLDDNHESGAPNAERSIFIVRVFSRAYNAADQARVDSAVTALRNAGLYVGSRGPLIKDDNARYWQYNIEASTWEVQ